MNIAIVGTGYVGLVTGVCFSEMGFTVTCVDVDEKKIAMLRQAKSPIFEPGLPALLEKNINNQRLRFTTNLADVINDVEVVFSAVGTPPDEDGSADLQYVLDVARTIGQNIKNYLLVVTKSTVPVGTAQKVKNTINEELAKRGVKVEFDVASNPEFLKEGSAVNDFMHPDRVVCGVESDHARKILELIYRPFILNGHQVIITDIPSAEMIKYAANAMLATRISFMNEIANLCERVGANVDMVRKGIGSDTRIGGKFLYSGIGYGGSCFPKDVKALIKTAEENGQSLQILKAVEDVNFHQKGVLFEKVKKYYHDDLKGKTIAILGLSFKPNTDDMREAPALTLIDKLLEAECEVKAFDPTAMAECYRRIGDSITYCNNLYETATGADALLLVTEWPEFRIVDFPKLKSLMKKAVIFDGRNIFNPEEVHSNGFDYFAIGK